MVFMNEKINSIMTTHFISIPCDFSIRQAMKTLISQAETKDEISSIFVLDGSNKLLGTIDLKSLIIAREHIPLTSITKEAKSVAYINETIVSFLDRFCELPTEPVPVLLENHMMAGILTPRILSELLDEEKEEDYARLAGLSASEDLHESLLQSLHKRLPWLTALLFLGLLVSYVVGLFEEVVAGLTLIVCFQSLILDMAGNAGTQSLAVTIRVLTDPSAGPKEKLKLIRKEARIGLCIGLILGFLSFLVIGLYLSLLRSEPARLAFSVSFCTGFALFLSMFLSSISGTAVPILFEKLGADPAVASGPLITTLNDLVAVITYYGLAWLLLIYTLSP